MSFSPTPGRRVVINGRNPRNGVSPGRRELSPVPAHNYGYNNERRSPSPNPPGYSRPRRQVNNDTSIEMSKPLLEPDARNPGPPLAGPEVDDLDSDDRETVHHSQPGVDDGFFSNGDNSGGEGSHPDTELIPDKPKHDPEIPKYPEGPYYPDTDEPDLGRYPANYPRNYPSNPEFPYAPGFGPDVYNTIPDYPPTEFGSDSLPDVNVYQHKKTLAQGMMDLALFSANANQLRYVLESSSQHPYYYPSIVFISFSLFFQVAVGVGLIWNSRYNVKDKREICIANKINNFTVIGIFLITVINVFISAFGVANTPTVITVPATTGPTT
ncbi:Ninjurin A [Carabus blaptoides fortunei]